MKITKRQLRSIIKEELATLNRDVIEDEVMQVLSDEGGAAGEEPIADALEDLEDEDISLPNEPIEDIIDAVPGVKRHKDGDFVDTTQLESRDSFLRHVIRESLIRENLQKLFQQFDEIGFKLADMSSSDPDYEDVSLDYEIMEDKLEELGYEIASSLNPFKVDSGKIKSIETGEVVHTRKKR